MYFLSIYGVVTECVSCLYSTTIQYCILLVIKCVYSNAIHKCIVPRVPSTFFLYNQQYSPPKKIKRWCFSHTAASKN